MQAQEMGEIFFKTFTLLSVDGKLHKYEKVFFFSVSKKKALTSSQQEKSEAQTYAL